MLLNLHVKNLALIGETEVDFGPGLNILSGETGAGKSILIGSINLALGEKAQKNLLREGAEYALVELTFSVEQSAQVQALRELDIFPEDGQILMTRRLAANGRSVCRINSETVSAALMRRVASLLIDIHGQHEHQSLLTRKNHLRYLDAWAGHDLEEKKGALASCYHTWSACKRQLEEASMDEEQQNRELSFLQYEIDEIAQAQLRPGEDEQLETEFRRLSHGRKILEALAECRALCVDGSGNIPDASGRALRALLHVSEYDEQVGALAAQLQEIDCLINDFNRDLCGYMDDFEFSEELFAEVESRLDQINQLKSKYGKTIDLILEQKEKKEAEAERLLHYDEYRRNLEAKLSGSELALREISEEVSGIRKSAAKIFADEIKNALVSLNFQDVRLELEFQRLEHYTESGWDDVRFLISTNPGEPLKPLDTVASGGELSRIMLALKTVLAENDEIETLIFDEIDSGISGRTAQRVAEKIKQTARNHQVICITHLPQIASMADSHFLIEKTSEELSTISRICALDREESIQELARMLGGTQITDSVMQTAREMKDLADAVRTYSV
ncbi:MAG: DNA repair protein RecN [Lachnospiraceae bacterium]|nr:DNA repair protein RecN [Lachnospiraceae bacterium]